ncbi:hypothetical protein CKA32_001752 [Geitlerinema sp. FC II]|nr:hypothetical protein [Geitlerinema sp. CS-897]PPT09417.1 hypothetical protein CKA32_001752 [Geitlerinema sp. FC II]
MQNIYRPIPDVNIYDRIDLVEDLCDEDLLGILHLLGYPASSKNPQQEWNPVRVKIKPGQKSGHFPGFIGFHLIFNEKSVKILYPLIEGYVKLFPLVYDSGDRYFAIGVLEVVDCLNYSLAQIQRSSAGRVIRVKKYAFYEERIGDRPIFRLPEENVALVSDRFKECVEQHQLEGLIFQKVT